MDNKVDLKKVVDRLKGELGLQYDNELSLKLGQEKKYISVMKGRGTFGGKVWVKIFNLAREEDISMDWILYGKLGRGMTAEGIARSTISNAIKDKDKRDEAVRRLSEAIVTHKSLHNNKRSEDILDLANILIAKLMSED